MTVHNKRPNIRVINFFDLCTYLCIWSNYRCNGVIISILRKLDLILWSTEEDECYFFSEYIYLYLRLFVLLRDMMNYIYFPYLIYSFKIHCNCIIFFSYIIWILNLSTKFNAKMSNKLYSNLYLLWIFN